MRAYDLAMMLVFINCAFPIISAMGINIAVVTDGSSVFWDIYNLFSTPVFTISGVAITGLMALAIAMALGTVIIVGTNVITDRGIAMIVFITIFWGSFAMASVSLMGIIFKYTGFTIFWFIFLLGSTFIFINALVQFPTGGQGAHV